MDKIVIEGGRPLNGEVRISGAKNAALPLIAATLLARGEHVLHNVPDLRDTRTILALLETFNLTWKRDGATLYINSNGMAGYEASYDLVKTMRASVLVLGPLLAGMGRARVSLPGGCAIGARPIDFHLLAFEKMGATLELEQGYVDARTNGRLSGATIYFDIPSVTGTENVLMAAATADGTTIMKNAAREPEVGNLIDMLNAMGARIEGRDTDRLTIHGVEELHPTEMTVIPDRIEAGTYLLAVAAVGGDVTLTGCIPAHLPTLTEKLREMGLTVEEGQDFFHVVGPPGKTVTERVARLRSVDIKTRPYPGFPTDLQAQIMALATMTHGLSVITETIFENRFMHVAELKRMGADIQVNGNSAIVKGGVHMRGAQVMATDLRASASLVVAGLAAEGVTEISRIYHLERGYENLVEKFSSLGACIRKERA